MQESSIRVLIVEDDLLVSEMIRGLVEDIGHQVVGEAAHGRKALDLLSTLVGSPTEPQVVLMDIEMPEMGGIKATSEIMARFPLPVVALTAYETPLLVEQMTDAGVGAYLVKPSNQREMERAIIIAMARFDDIITLRGLNTKLEDRNHQLSEALDQIKTLTGLLPICAHCKKIRDDTGYWQQVEVYLSNRTDAQFTHGICPECQISLYPPEIYPYLYQDDQDASDA